MKTAVQEYLDEELTLVGLLASLMEDDRDLATEPIEALPVGVVDRLVAWTQDWQTASLPHTRSGEAELERMRHGLRRVYERVLVEGLPPK
ncbi:MAG: hypothetical protein KBF43_17040 [Dermatophilaceae bacterium]|nr:hypothetical protein [Dermatophilaceae bacterium]